ncbi:TetR/AcrR family transcriptional regulator [Curtobacterium sp. ISL-83]|uniref:TetR/AcrR family transcriptional regulator n=1 Tax=Curtobacterium sp. ISL-83 TaxID=2819145 RepID=UPI001BEC896A|nr:TetR/AcrR family transcriptional regulator [Curtobacterium sp. ISL-83]MBT2501269.1 WHG domain-containing protein [Curtobacterium sp. ISL-83]
MAEKAPTARERARASVHASILAAARERLTVEGPAQLSLRAVARDVGMVSSAVYRYFPSRDDLLTALLVLDYDELGSAVETAEARHDRRAVGARWVAACRAIRAWALGHPGDFALLYGSPVPGYVAPQETIVPAVRTTRVLVRVVVDAWAARADGHGHGRGHDPDGGRGARSAPATAPGAVATAVADAARWARNEGFGDDLPDEVVLRTVMAWTTVFGVLSFELFGHAVGSVSDGDAYFDEVVARLADDLGFAADFGAPALRSGAVGS